MNNINIVIIMIKLQFKVCIPNTRNRAKINSCSSIKKCKRISQ
jgi:hypothetical protein